MSSRNHRFNSAMASLEDAIGKTDDKSQFVMMYGQYVSPEEMYAYLDGESKEALRLAQDEAQDAALQQAEKRLCELGKGHLVPTLELIFMNGNNRRWSIKVLQANCKGGTHAERYERAKRMYYRHRDELIKIFGVTSRPTQNGALGTAPPTRISRFSRSTRLNPWESVEIRGENKTFLTQSSQRITQRAQSLCVPFA